MKSKQNVYSNSVLYIVHAYIERLRFVDRSTKWEIFSFNVRFARRCIAAFNITETCVQCSKSNVEQKKKMFNGADNRHARPLPPPLESKKMEKKSFRIFRWIEIVVFLCEIESVVWSMILPYEEWGERKPRNLLNLRKYNDHQSKQCFEFYFDVIKWMRNFSQPTMLWATVLCLRDGIGTRQLTIFIRNDRKMIYIYWLYAVVVVVVAAGVFRAAKSIVKMCI